MPAWLRVYLATEAVVETGVQVVRGAVDGVWLGLLDERRLGVLDAYRYGSETTWTSDEHNRRGLFDWEQHLVTTSFTPGSRLAVTGAGGGRELLALSRMGYRVTGYEPHPALAAAAARLLHDEGVDVAVFTGGREGWPAGDASFDGVLLGWGSYMLVPDRRARIDLLRAASRATGDRGAVALSYFEMPDAPVQMRTVRRVAAPLRRARRAAPAVLGDALVPNFVHYFSRRQVREEVAAAGMELVATGSDGYGWAVARHAGASSPGR